MQSSHPIETTGLIAGKQKPQRLNFFGNDLYLFGARPSLETALKTKETPNIVVEKKEEAVADTEDRIIDDKMGIEMIPTTVDNTPLSLDGSFQGNHHSGDITSMQSGDTEVDQESESSVSNNIAAGFKYVGGGISNAWASLWNVDWSCGTCRRFNYDNISDESRPMLK